MYYGKHLLSIPFDCAFVAGGQHQDTVRQTSHSRKRRAAMAEATASFDITLDYFDQLFDEHLPPSRRLVGKSRDGLCFKGWLMLYDFRENLRFLKIQYKFQVKQTDGFLNSDSWTRQY